MNQKKWDSYLKLPANEEMNSFHEINQLRIDDAVNRIPDNVKNILCIGCGDGYELVKIPNSIGIELNSVSLQKCKEKGLKCLKMDMHEMSFKDQEFDLVFARHILEHSFATWIAFLEICRVAKKYVLIVLPDKYTGADSGWHFLIPTELQIKAMAKKCGFQVIDIWRNDLSRGGVTSLIEDGYLLKSHE